MTTPAAAPKVAAATVERAVTALLKWKEAQSESQKAKLIPDDEFIYLILTLKKIPPKSRTNAFKIPLPHPLHTSPELCLIIDDRPNSKPDSDSVKKIIKAQNVSVSKVLKLSKLKTNYKPFEAKRKLCDSFDLFLVDKRVVHFMPKLLGKQFFKKKKVPVPVDMTHKNWGEQVESACGAGLLYMRTGTCCVMKVGKVAMENDEIVKNVVEGIEGVVNVVSKKWGGVRSLHLKLADSVALPLYQALPDVRLKIEGLKEEEAREEVMEAKAESGDEEGVKGKKKKKGRIHEVRYMDVGLIEEEFGGEEDSEEEGMQNAADESAGEEATGDENVEKKRKKGGVENVGSDEDSEEEGTEKAGEESAGEESSDDEYMGKKRKKGGVENVRSDEDGEEGEDKGSKKAKAVKGRAAKKVDGEKQLKKGRRVEKTEGVKRKKGGDELDAKKGKKKSDLVVKSKEGSTKAKDRRSKNRLSA